MSQVIESAVMESRGTRDLLSADRVDLTPVSARQAVGRYSGIERVDARRPLWRSAGTVGLVALIAAAALPLLAQALSVSG